MPLSLCYGTACRSGPFCLSHVLLCSIQGSRMVLCYHGDRTARGSEACIPAVITHTHTHTHTRYALQWWTAQEITSSLLVLHDYERLTVGFLIKTQEIEGKLFNYFIFYGFDYLKSHCCSSWSCVDACSVQRSRVTRNSSFSFCSSVTPVAIAVPFLQYGH